MYKKVSTDLKFVDREKETEKFWEENHIFEKSMIRTDCRLNWKLKSSWAWMERIRSKSMVWSRSLTNVKRVSGNIKECGKISQAP